LIVHLGDGYEEMGCRMMDTEFAAAKMLSAGSIPVVDVSGVVDGTNVHGVAAAIHAAATDQGFFYISGHGIDPALIERAFAVSKAFFALPEADKATIAVNTHQRGWMAQGMSRLAGSKTHDLKEVFFWGTETASDDPDVVAGKPLVAVNQWPTEVFPDLERDLRPYYDALCTVARQVMTAIAVSLDQPASFFDPMYQKPLARGQLVYYPPSTTADEAEERFGVAPHTDFGVLTFLLQDNSGGLQVKAKSGDWIEAPPIPGTLVCNIGDLLQRWSNNRFASTVHRVVNRTPNARYSIPVFFDPHTDTVVDPVDLGVSQDKSLFEPVTAGAHIAGRNRKSFSQYKA
jgi:isopenicillin N synthase-like dioxygenase